MIGRRRIVTLKPSDDSAMGALPGALGALETTMTLQPTDTTVRAPTHGRGLSQQRLTRRLSSLRSIISFSPLLTTHKLSPQITESPGRIKRGLRTGGNAE
jgi:hypothetical protein